MRKSLIAIEVEYFYENLDDIEKIQGGNRYML